MCVGCRAENRDLSEDAGHHRALTSAPDRLSQRFFAGLYVSKKRAI